MKQLMLVLLFPNICISMEPKASRSKSKYGFIMDRKYAVDCYLPNVAAAQAEEGNERKQIPVTIEQVPKATVTEYLQQLSTIKETNASIGEVFNWSDLDVYEAMQSQSLNTYQGIIKRYKHAIVAHRAHCLMGLSPIEDTIQAVNQDKYALHYVIAGRYDANKLISYDEFMDWWSDIKKDVKKKLNNPEFMQTRHQCTHPKLK